MNKNVFEYLNGKAQQVTDYIRTKAEAAGNYLSEHAQDIKQGAIKTTATVLTAATLMGGMTGCTPKNSEEQAETYYPIATVKPKDELEEIGITAQDVLDAYDALSLKAHKTMETPNEDDLKKNKDWTSLSARFIQLTPQINIFPDLEEGLGNGYAQPEPFYFYHYRELQDTTAYFSAIVYDAAIRDNLFSNTYNNAGIPKEIFENLMNAFNVESFVINEDYFIQNPQYEMAFYYLIGETVYEPFVIDRSVIENASIEQLWALYDIATYLTNSIRPLDEYYEDRINNH